MADHISKVMARLKKKYGRKGPSIDLDVEEPELSPDVDVSTGDLELLEDKENPAAYEAMLAQQRNSPGYEEAYANASVPIDPANVKSEVFDSPEDERAALAARRGAAMEVGNGGSGSHGIKRFVEQGLLAAEKPLHVEDRPFNFVDGDDEEDWRPQLDDALNRKFAGMEADRDVQAGVNAQRDASAKRVEDAEYNSGRAHPNYPLSKFYSDKHEAHMRVPSAAEVRPPGIAAHAGRGALKAVRGATATADLEQQGPDIQAPDMTDPSVTHMYDSDQEPTEIPEPVQTPQPDPRQTQSPVQAHPQRPGAPQDDSAYYAALKGIATAGRGSKALGNMDLGGGYYDQKIKQEGQKQANYQAEVQDWRSQNAALLKQKFAQDNIRLKDDLGNGDEKLELSKRRLKLAEDNSKGVQGRFDQKQINALVEDMPSMRSVQSFKSIRERLKDPTPIEGWDANVVAGMGDVNGALSIIGKPFEILSHNMRKGSEAEGVMTDLMSIFQDITVKTTGKQVNESEMRRLQTRLGIAAGQSQAAFRRAYSEELKALQNEVGRHFNSLDPNVQKMAVERGLMPDWESDTATPYAPKVKRDSVMHDALNSNGPGLVDRADKAGLLPPGVGPAVKAAFDGAKKQAPSSGPDIYNRNAGAAIEAAQAADWVPAAPVPNAFLPTGVDEAAGTNNWLDKVINWAQSNGSAKDALQVAKDNEDEEKRTVKNKANGL